MPATNNKFSFIYVTNVLVSHGFKTEWHFSGCYLFCWCITWYIALDLNHFFYPLQKHLNTSPIQRADTLSMNYYSWCNPAADDPVMAHSLCLSVSLSPLPLFLSLCLSTNRSSHANVSFLSQPLQSTQCPPGPHRLSNLSWPECQWQPVIQSMKTGAGLLYESH